MASAGRATNIGKHSGEICTCRFSGRYQNVQIDGFATGSAREDGTWSHVFLLCHPALTGAAGRYTLGARTGPRTDHVQ